MSHGTGNSMDKASAKDIVKPRTGRVGCQIRMPEDMQRHAASQHTAGASKTDPDGFGAAGVGPAAGGGPNRRGRTPPPFFQGEPAGADPAAGRIVIFITGTRQGDAMECAEGSHTVCWFCRKGRHGDCMGSIPHDARSDGPHDCTFDTDMVPCGCGHCSGAPN